METSTFDVTNVDYDDKDTWDLTVVNPNIIEKIDKRTPKEIISEIDELNKSLEENLTKVKKML